MKRIIALVALVLLLLAHVDAPVVQQDVQVASMMQTPQRVLIDHLSNTRTSDGTVLVYCIVQNVGADPVTQLRARITATNDSNEVVRVRNVVIFDGDTLPPDAKAIFTSSFEECWDCSSVLVALY